MKIPIILILILTNLKIFLDCKFLVLVVIINVDTFLFNFFLNFVFVKSVVVVIQGRSSTHTFLFFTFLRLGIPNLIWCLFLLHTTAVDEGCVGGVSCVVLYRIMVWHLVWSLEDFVFLIWQVKLFRCKPHTLPVVYKLLFIFFLDSDSPRRIILSQV